jgi:hypothetical protein
LLYPAADLFGLIGVASVIVGSSFVTVPLQLYYVLSIVQQRTIELVNLIGYPLVGSVAMAGSVRALDIHILAGTTILNLILLVVSGIVSYLILMVSFDRIFGLGFVQQYHLLKQNI